MLTYRVLRNLSNIRGAQLSRLINIKQIYNGNQLRPITFKHRVVDDDTVCPNLMRGIDYTRIPHFNKGLAFTMEERQVLGIQGLLAANVKTQEEQLAICTYSVDRYKNPLNKYLYLSELLDTNEKLFYKLLGSNIEKYLPLVYTPTVGLACQRFGLVYRRPRGLFITIHDKGRIHKILRNWPEKNVRAICVTDGERILGLGDLGAYGMGIPVGKLCLYTALAGVPPAQCLPITLDVGTNNPLLLEDPLYIGLRKERVTGKRYDEFIQEFMEACTRVYSQNVLIQFEDFAIHNAGRLLNKYKASYCTFNDDIQGTASVIVAGMFAACRITKKKFQDNIYLFLGAGSAGVGIANLICDAMVEEGISREEAISKIYMFDVDGLLSTRRPGGVPPHAIKYGRNIEPTQDFEGFVKTIKATCLIGVSTVGGAFTPPILQQMARNAERPQIYALSNPTLKAECTPQQAYDYTEGRCIYASGSPFLPVNYKNRQYITGQGNNSYIFPGVALGTLLCYSHHVPDSMFLTAAKTLARNVSQRDLDVGRIYPPLNNIWELSCKIAEAIIERAYCLNLAGKYPKPKDLAQFVRDNVYDTKYSSYLPDLYSYPEEGSKIKVKTISDMVAAFKVKNKSTLEQAQDMKTS
ncbi:NADP-dependent malic enzyme-like [Spodoptera frugiperda]|uniref:Malic enzyme n=1 Tax=Spodoptera frugiperda TaxID=7108 RepID=A0A9R0DKN4_SPOFR|nr:NADP-dependent malic enzyme-like [Spodoptera frugiperda]